MVQTELRVRVPPTEQQHIRDHQSAVNSRMIPAVGPQLIPAIWRPGYPTPSRRPSFSSERHQNPLPSCSGTLINSEGNRSSSQLHRSWGTERLRGTEDGSPNSTSQLKHGLSAALRTQTRHYWKGWGHSMVTQSELLWPMSFLLRCHWARLVSLPGQ